eukprot:PhM_4_TR3734/c0_g1_i1/m.14986
MKPVRAAVILAGCGVFDGAEITEAVSTLVRLSQRGATVQCYAPVMPQGHVVNHLTGEPVEGDTRCVAEEASRIFRSPVGDVAKVTPEEFDVVIFPGGFGVMKNLSTFAFKGADGAIVPSVQKLIQDAHAAKKPIGAACIAPVILAKALGTAAGGPGVTLTTGLDSDQWAEMMKAMGNEPKACDVRGTIVDSKNLVVTTPAYMSIDATPATVFEGISKMVDDTLAFLK